MPLSSKAEEQTDRQSLNNIKQSKVCVGSSEASVNFCQFTQRHKINILHVLLKFYSNKFRSAIHI